MHPMKRKTSRTGGARVQQPGEKATNQGSVADAPTAFVVRLEDDLVRTQTELRSLRNQLQPWETIVPTQAVDDFRQINKMVKEVCRTISESILSQKFADVTNPTTLHLANASLKAFAEAIGGCDSVPSLIVSRSKKSRPLDDVLEYGLRSIINQDLSFLIFEPFHPSLVLSDGAVSKELWDMYREIREQKSSLISGMWRANTFYTLDSMDSGYFSTLVSHFLDRLSGHLKILKGLNDSGQGFVLSDENRRQLEETFRFAHGWNAKVKSAAILTNFHTVCSSNDAPFASSTMVPYDRLETPEGSPRILCAVTLGLKSPEVPNEGGKPLDVWHEKIQVLTQEYFNDRAGSLRHR